MNGSSRAWTWRHAFASSDLPSTTKAVLHTLGMFMNELGEGCYPSVADICRYSGLDKKTVLKHLGTARDAGWIAVSQHGYRGQRWKRQEYAARWPERDLVAACAPDDQNQGGGANPPPSDAEKVVDFVPEGGGIEGSKVVEHVHQDKTSPVNIPNTTPSERARESDDDGRESRKSVERSFKRGFHGWPTAISDSEPEAFRVWLSLTPEERQAAVDEAPRYVEAAKATGRKLVCSYAVYLRERRWEKLPAKAVVEQSGSAQAAPLGKMWGARVYELLLNGPTRVVGLTQIEKGLVDSGRYSEEYLLHDKQAKQGFPAVNELFERAAGGRGALVPARLQAIKDLLVQVRIGGDEWKAWADFHSQQGWPWFPDPGNAEWAYFPAGGPEGLNGFEIALRGLGENDGN
ncbi:helix-turn-helix domain-containing protein [Brucella sp. JSBI001]|uniref:helix-turn-helix domain-containing protein n=1 Tax=Brucella sp. JSBI001 TaxID=2886044 RepID=UPI00222FD215|nr:helix-turn-helix domain-containing protein [Brucella sp. JSBI001]UZD70800.1 helix-turn-helix domain-containing protein [Brucella sp. JSBI001]